MIGNPLRVRDLISELSCGGVRIPEIQRSYVWRRRQIAKLLDSLYHGYPAGSVLLWDTASGIQMRDMATGLGRDVKPDFMPKIVLDGQQRLTSLARVFDPSTPKQEHILFNVMHGVFEPYSSRQAADPCWIDTTELLTDAVTELDVLDRLEEAGIIDGNDREQRREIHTRLKQLAAIREYQFPVEIVREGDLETVTEIFIRVNSAGTRLREAELALARLAWKLPGSIVGPFERLQSDCEDRGFDSIDTRFLVRALISVATRQSRFKDLKAFWARPAQEIQSSWDRTETGLRLALDFVEGNVGIPGSALLPSHMSLIPLVVVFSEQTSLNGASERALRRWFLLANAFSRYVGATETTLNQDLNVLGKDAGNTEALLEQTLRDLRAQPSVRPDDLERSGMGNPLFCLAYLAVVRREATDWFRGIRIRRESFAEDQNIEYHHIFPKKQLNARGVDRYTRDEMANIAFLSQKANRRILARAPDDYLAEIAEHDPARLEAQFVPMDRDLWHLDRFEQFLIARRKLLADAMTEVLQR